MDTVAMAAKYEARVREQEMVQKEDFSDMVAEHAAKQKVRISYFPLTEMNKYWKNCTLERLI